MTEAHVMTFQEHLAELRSRLIRVAAAIAIGFFACWSWRVEIFGFLSGPIARALADHGVYQFQAIEITESIMVYLKTSVVAAIVLTSPWIFYQLWAFVAPGLHRHEKRFVLPVTAFSVIFFLIGAAFAYQVILPFITDFLVSLTLEGGQAEVMVTLQNAYSTAFIFLLLFGATFELPLVVFFLSLFGLVTWRGLWRFFRYFVVLSFVIGAILTPPDPVSQILLAVPLNVLYGFGILVAWGVERSRDETGAARDAGMTLTRLMGASLLLMALAAVLVVAFLRALPERDLARLLPERATWMVGGNPAVLAEAPEADTLLRRQGGLTGWVAALGGAGVAVEAVREAAVVGDVDGQRALLVRAEGLSASRPAVEAALADPSAAAVLALDEDTLVLGAPGLVEAFAAVARDDAPALAPDEEEERLLRDLRSAGPVWAWIPSPARDLVDAVPSALAAQTAACGAVLRLEDPPRLSLAFHVADKAHGDAVEAQLDALRTLSRRQPQDRDQRLLLEAVRALAAEVAREAPADRRAALEALRARLDTAAGEIPVPDGGTVLALGRGATGWALRRADLRVTLTAQLAPDALDALAAPLLAALR